MNTLPLPEQKIPVNNENNSMCTACKGACCKRFAGTVYPYQINPLTPEKVLEMLQGDYCLDDWHGDPREGKRKIGLDHPNWHDFGDAGMNERLNDESFLEFPDQYPELPLVSRVFYVRPKHMSWDIGFKPTLSLAENILATLSAFKEERLVRINKPHDQSWGGRCVFLDDATGCKLKFEDRPHICQHLVPNYNFETKETNCNMTSDLHDLHGKRLDAMIWLPHQNVLERALEMYYEHEQKSKNDEREDPF